MSESTSERRTSRRRHRPGGLLALAVATLATCLSAITLSTSASADADSNDGGGVPNASPTSPRTAPQSSVTVESLATGVPGIDTSRHQHQNEQPINWSAVAQSGQRFVYMKATEGTTYKDSWFDRDFAAAKAAGLYVGGYVFARPDKDPVATADHFVNTLGSARYAATPGGKVLPPMIDLEWPYAALPYGGCWNKTPAQMRAWIDTFVNRIRTRTGRQPIIYTGTSWWNPCTGNHTGTAASGATLAVARWTSSRTPEGSPGTLPAGWSNWTLWQYTNEGSVPGVPTLVDRDLFNGGTAALQAFAERRVTNPTPPDVYQPFGKFDYLAARGGGTIGLYGWAADPDTPTTSIPVHIYVWGSDGVKRGPYVLTANRYRADVGQAYPGYGNYHGWDVTLGGLPRGYTKVQAFAIDSSNKPGDYRDLGVRYVTVT